MKSLSKLLLSSSFTFLGIFLLAQKPELILPIGHTEKVQTVSFSPDGKYAVSGSSDNTLKLWEVASGREIYTFRGHSSIVFSAAFTPDSKYILSCSGDETLKLWQVNTGKEIRTFNGHTESVYALAVSPDGNYVLSGAGDKSIKLWEIATSKEIYSVTNHKDNIRSLAFSPDGKLFASGSWDKSVKIWEVKTGKEIKNINGHEKHVESVFFSPDGNLLLSGSNDQTIKLWEVKSGKELKSFQGPDYDNFWNAVNAVTFSPDGKYIAAAGVGQIIRLWNIKSGKEISTFNGHTSSINSISFSPDGKMIISGSGKMMGEGDNSVRFWDVSLKKELPKFQGYTHSVSTVTFSRDGKKILIGNIGRTIKLWEVEKGKVSNTLKGHHGAISCITYSPDGKYILTGSEKDNGEIDETIKLWDADTGKELRSFEGGGSFVYSASFSKSGKYVITGHALELKLWNAISGKEIKTIDGDGYVVYHPNENNILFESKYNNNLVLLDISTGKEVVKLQGHEDNIRSIAISPDGKTAVSGSQDKMAKLWDLSTGKEIFTFKGHSNFINAVSFSFSGKYVLTGSSDNLVKLWDVKSGKELFTFNGHTNYVKSVAFSPDGKYAISGAEDNTVKIWDINRGIELASLLSSTNSNDWVVYAPDGRFDASKNVLKKMYYVKNLEVIPFDALFEKYYTPNLLGRLIEGEKFEDIGHIDDIKLPPSVNFKTPDNNHKTRKKQITISIEAQDQGGGIDEIRLYQNGKLISGTGRGLKSTGKFKTKSFEVTLALGENVFKTIAINKDRIESRPDEVRVIYEGAEATAELFLLVVGINRYRNPVYNLNYAEADATAFQKQIEKGSASIFKLIHPKHIKDNQATKSNILAAFEEIKVQAGPEDMLVFYYAGHGVMNEGLGDKQKDFYLIPYDVTKMYGADEMLERKAISSAELTSLSKNIKAHKQIFIMDACQSGGALELMASRGAAEEKAIAQLARSTGTYWLAASGSEQLATEFKELGHGVFTYAIIEGLKGAADGKNNDKKITAKELGAYIEDKVPELTEKHKGQAQFPRSYGFGQDFPIVIIIK